ncbi:MAG: hypothetical protein WCJ72_00470 [Chryseobacterium sp.]
MIFYYDCGGKLNISGCSRMERRIYVFYKWGERSVVYIKPKAIRGILEKIAIRKVILNNKNDFYNPIYQDSLNSLYNESELISELEAINYVQDYIEKRKKMFGESISDCSANSI